MGLTRKAMCFVSVCHVVKTRHLNAILATKELETEFFPEAVGSKTKDMNEDSRFRSIKFKEQWPSFAEIFKSNSDKLKHGEDNSNRLLAFCNYNKLFMTTHQYLCLLNKLSPNFVG